MRRSDLGFQSNVAGVTNPTAFLRRKQAFGFGPNRAQIATDGAMTATVSGNWIMPTNATTLYIGGNAGGSLSGSLETIALYCGARNDAFVVGLTR